MAIEKEKKKSFKTFAIGKPLGRVRPFFLFVLELPDHGSGFTTSCQPCSDLQLRLKIKRPRRLRQWRKVRELSEDVSLGSARYSFIIYMPIHPCTPLLKK